MQSRCTYSYCVCSVNFTIMALSMDGVPSDRCQKEFMMREIYSTADKRRINKRLCGYSAARCYHPQGITHYTFTNTISSHSTHLMSFLFSYFTIWHNTLTNRWAEGGLSQEKHNTDKVDVAQESMQGDGSCCCLSWKLPWNPRTSKTPAGPAPGLCMVCFKGFPQSLPKKKEPNNSRLLLIPPGYWFHIHVHYAWMSMDAVNQCKTE